MSSTLLPFEIDFRDSASMTDQVVAGMRRAILSGVYPVGAKVPSLTEMSKQLGVSLIVVRRAVSRLTEEGLLNPRQGYGVVVSNPKVPRWNGTVLFVTGEHKAIYFTHFIVEALRRQLQSHGFLLSHVVLTRDRKGAYQLDQLKQTMLQSVRLAVVYNADESVIEYLAGKKCPCVAPTRIENNTSIPCVGRFTLDFKAPFEEMMRRPAFADVRRALVVGLPKHTFFESAQEALRSAGITCQPHVVTPLRHLPRPESVQRAVMEDFLSARSPLDTFRPDFVFFSDDYIAAGALTAMLARGIRIPEDVRVVSFANVGLGPVFVKPVSRLAARPKEIGMIFAKAVLDFLKKGRFPEILTLPIRYEDGETFPSGVR